MSEQAELAAEPGTSSKRVATATKPLSVRLPIDAYDFLRGAGEKEGRTITTIVLKLLAEEARRAGIDPSWA